MRRTLVLAALAVLCVSAVPLCGEQTEAIEDGAAFYFYGDNPGFMYEFEKQPGVTIGWKVFAEDGTPMEFEYVRDDVEIRVDMADQPYGSRVMIHQTVYLNGEVEDETSQYAMPLHIGSDVYEVRFVDGSRAISTQRIDSHTMVKEGQDHVVMPDTPRKEGYYFEGWYEDEAFTKEFDPKSPVKGDTIVRAKWSATADVTEGEEVVGDNHVITFEVTSGLEYRIIDTTDTTISFLVSVVGGYTLADGTLSVRSDGGSISGSEMLFSLSGIDRDIVVTITGDVRPIVAPQGDGGEPFPWWIIVVIVIVLAAVILLYLRKRKAEE